MPASQHLITVYLTPTSGELRRVADAVHGIAVDPQSIGYSFRNDLSMVGIIPRQLYGTLAHELFHLMVRRDFGDVPPWLDEGYAGCYEVSRIQPDGSVLGQPNWRGDVLKNVWHERPTIEQLLNADWTAFEAEGYQISRQAANHASARYFALYLQEHGKLAEVYRTFRARDLLEITDPPAVDAVKRIESILGRNVADIDADFVSWFRRTHG